MVVKKINRFKQQEKLINKRRHNIWKNIKKTCCNEKKKKKVPEEERGGGGGGGGRKKKRKKHTHTHLFSKGMNGKKTVTITKTHNMWSKSV